MRALIVHILGFVLFWQCSRLISGFMHSDHSLKYSVGYIWFYSPSRVSCMTLSVLFTIYLIMKFYYVLLHLLLYSTVRFIHVKIYVFLENWPLWMLYNFSLYPYQIFMLERILYFLNDVNILHISTDIFFNICIVFKVVFL